MGAFGRLGIRGGVAKESLKTAENIHRQHKSSADWTSHSRCFCAVFDCIWLCWAVLPPPLALAQRVAERDQQVRHRDDADQTLLLDHGQPADFMLQQHVDYI